MNESESVIRVLWVAAPRQGPPEDLPGLEVEVQPARAPDAAEQLGEAAADLAVLDTRGFADPAALLRHRDALALPALICAAAAELDALLPALGEVDDLVLHGAPPALLSLRLARLLERRDLGRDRLTGLQPRGALVSRLEALLPGAAAGAPLSLVLLDIDHFKALNDRHGHAAGDAALRELARRTTAAMPPEAFIARHGGEEFTALLSAGEDEALALAEGVRQAAREAAFSGDVRLTVSAGVATADGPTTPRRLLRQVDEALYAAKAGGRDQVVHYAALEREALRMDGDVDLFAFENITKVIAERVADVITWRGRRLFREIKQQADVDSLTGLFNRRYLDRRLGFELAEAQGARRPLTVALVDIDFFGRVNKEHGWPAGDKVLAELAALLRRGVRSQDWAARYGGEEFMLVMTGAPLAEAAAALERLRLGVRAHPFVTPDGAPLELTISAGLAQHRGPGEDHQALVQRASDQLLRAKRGGRDQVRGQAPGEPEGPSGG